MSPLRATSTLYSAGSAFSIDDVHSDTWQAYLRSWSVPLLPGPRLNLVDIAGAVGKDDVGSELSSRLVALDVSVFEPDRQRMHALLRAFALALDPRTGPHRVEFVDEFPDWYISANVSNDVPVQPSQAAVTAAFTLNMEAADPFFYSKTPQSIDHRYPAAPQPFTVENLGSESTPLVLTVRERTGSPGPLTGFTISVGDVDIVYAPITPLSSSDVVVVDTGQMTVTRNGVNDLAHWSGDFPLLPPGEVEVVWADPGAVGGQVNFAYRERLL